MPLLFILAIVMSIVIALAIAITTTVAIYHFETPALLWGSSCLMLSGPVALLPSRHFGLRPRIPRMALKVVFRTLAFQQKDPRIAFEVRLNQRRSSGKSLEKTWGWLWRV